MNRKIDHVCLLFVFLMLALGCKDQKSKEEIVHDKRIEKITKRSRLFEGKPELLEEFGKVPAKEDIKPVFQPKGKILMLRRLSDDKPLSVFPFQYDFMDDFFANDLDEVGTVILEVLEDGSSSKEVVSSSKSPTGVKKETTKTRNDYGWHVYVIDRAENAVVYKTFVSTHSTITTKSVDGKSRDSFSGGDELENLYKRLFGK
jgi:hypothetical protein